MCAQVEQSEPWFAAPRAHALFAERAHDVVLEPNDALFIAVGWWHSVEAMTYSINVTSVCFGVPNKYPAIEWP
jgi:hypothetical protein